MVKLIPSVKEYIEGEKVTIDGYKFTLPTKVDNRIVKACSNIKEGNIDVVVSVKNDGNNRYDISFTENRFDVVASDDKQVFYAIQTLKQLLENGYVDAKHIGDFADYEERGFYLDITRGRIPTIETLKELVDTMAYFKLNMLQLYVEHVFPFKEYDGIYQKFGYISAEETKELDDYCYENYIELVPSLSCFGHLYELLQSDKYKHLCELENYEPSAIYWCERMGHHTIDATNEESINLIKSLIDQYMPLFRTDKFNICCDETMDLGYGRNKGKDKGELYFSFVKKIIDYVESKGKTPMMWGDIITQHPDFIPKLSENVIFLSWRYDANPDPDMINKIKAANRIQYVCPGVNSWTHLMELPQIAVPNITKMLKYGYDAGAKGVLNTCWGDYGHLASIYCCMYGMIFGAEKSWNVNGSVDSFDSNIDFLYYGYAGASELVKKAAKTNRICYWYSLLAVYSNELNGNTRMRVGYEPSPDEYNEAFEECEDIIPYLIATTWKNEKARKSLLIATEGIEIMIAMVMSRATGEKLGVNMSDVESWLKEFKEAYMEESKLGELKEVIHVIYTLAQKYLA